MEVERKEKIGLKEDTLLEGHFFQNNSKTKCIFVCINIL